jgi:hypothetical protein
MATSEHFRFKNKPNPILDEKKKWTRENPLIARLTPQRLDKYTIQVFGNNGTHRKVANDLHKALESSGFLSKYPLFSIIIEPMQ